MTARVASSRSTLVHDERYGTLGSLDVGSHLHDVLVDTSVRPETGKTS